MDFEEKGEEKLPFGVDVYTLKDIAERVPITECKAHLHDRLPGNPIYFDLTLDSKVKEEPVIKAIRCKFSCDYIPLQVVDWRDGDEFASNGLQLKSIRPLPPLGSIIISIPFNIYVCSKIPYTNRWDLEGYIEFSSSKGFVKKSIGPEPALRNIKLPDADWNALDGLGKLDKRGIAEI